MKIIVFSYNIPRPDHSSGERRFVALLELIAGKHEVDLCVTRFSEDYLKEEHQKHIPHLTSKGINVLPVRKGIVAETLKAKKYDIGFFEFYWIAEENIYLFWKYQPEAITIVDSVDVHFAREETQARLGQIPEKQVSRTRKREGKIYRKADITIAVSMDDVRIIRDTFQISNVGLVPNIVRSVPRKPGTRAPIVLFIGSFLWHPNADGVIWFIREIWPVIRSQYNQAQFRIVGNSPGPEVLALKDIPGVEVLGYVPETGPYLESSAVSIAPLRYGGGMKGKVNEAMAYGLPVVATSIGAQGFNAVDGKEMIIADDPKDFAKAVIRLLESPQQQEEIGLAGQQLNAMYCSPEMVQEQLEEIMKLAHSIRLSGNRESKSSQVFSWSFKMWLRNLLGTIRWYIKTYTTG